MKKLLLLLLLLSQATFAADLPRLKKLFRENFNTLYVPRACGTNIGKLVKLADSQGIDLTNSYVVVLENPGFWNLQAFGARGSKPGERQAWYFHVVLIADDQVFDFDFGNTPKVVPFKSWMKEMFVPKGKIDIPYDYKKDLAYFEFDFYASHDYLKNNGQTSTTPKQTFRLGQLMEIPGI